MKLFVYLSSFVFLLAQEGLLEGVSAVVGNTVILKSDVSQLVSMTALQNKIDINKNPSVLKKLQVHALENLINRQILLEMAKLDSIEVKDKDVNEALDRQVENIISQAGSVEIAEEYLGQSLRSYRRDYWVDIRDLLITEQYQFSLINQININRDGVVRFYEEYRDSLGFLPTLYRINHIQLSIKPSNKSLSDALSKINDIRNRIISGESFHSLAAAHSEDPGNSSRGGDLGYVERGALVSEFEAIAFTQEIGLVSNPVLTEFGYHIIETLDRKGEKSKIRHILINPKITESDETISFNFALALKDSAVNFNVFKKLAGLYSDDESTKKIGGDLGWVDLSNFSLPEFTKVIQTVSSLHSCSFPIKTAAGHHLVWISGVRPGGKPNLADHWPEVEKMALSQKKSIWFEGWLEQAASRLFISINEEH